MYNNSIYLILFINNVFPINNYEIAYTEDKNPRRGIIKTTRRNVQSERINKLA